MNSYKLSTEEVLKNLEANISGLTNAEASIRLQKYGKNELPRAKRFGPWLFLFEQIKSPLVFILILAGCITLAIREYIDMAVIFISVAVNIGIGFYQEYSSNKILEHLQKLIRVNARIIRDGRVTEMDSENLVPGDIVQLKPGMKVPADIRLLKVKEFAVTEAVLTGESNPVDKITEALAEDAAIGDRKNMAFMGTTVDRGDAMGVVVAIGSKTEIGKIAELTKKADEEKTPLQERLQKLGNSISILVAIAAVVIFIVGFYEDLGFVEIFITSVAVAVAAIPEGLPAALAVILAISSKKILKTGGLVKKLIAAESLGSTSVICCDKTGTLTEGKMKVEKLLTDGSEKDLLTALAMSNEALIDRNSDGTYDIKGESTDCAKIRAFLDAGLSYEETLNKMPLLATLPFNSVNKFLASFHRLNDHQVITYVTGTPELFINKSIQIESGGLRQINSSDTEKIKSEYEDLALRGMRMIGAGYRIIDEDPNKFESKKEQELADYANNIIFLGLAAIGDPIRSDVKEIMSEVESAGIRVVMITGDHKLTALAIGRELGILKNEGAVMDGEELNKLSDEELKERIRDIDIFARVDPEHKLRVVRAWKEVGESVAATGDGINDAPALKTADIGIAVASGTDVTKEAADLVMMNDSFATIVEAVRQGRTAFANIRKVTVFLLSGSFTELILIMGALILRVPLPLTALQILWTNLVEDGLPNFALAFEPADKHVMKHKPLKRGEPIVNQKGKALAYGVGILTDLVLFLIFFEFLGNSDYSIHYIRTFIFAALGTDSLFYIFSLRSLDVPIYKINHLKNYYFLFAIALSFVMMFGAIYIPIMNSVLDTEPLSLIHFVWIILLGFYKILLVELVKWWYNRKN